MDVSNVRLGAWNVTWKKAGAGSAFDLGTVDQVEPNLVIETKDLQVGSMGKVVIGKRIIGLSGSVKVQARESVVETWRGLLPWYSSGSIPLLPSTLNKDLYDYAGLLTLHPSEAGNTDTDITLVMAVPVVTPPIRDGDKDDQIIVEFFPFPDRAQFPDLVYGYIGPVPA